MKRILYFILLVVLFSACGKEKSFEDGTETGNFLRFKLDGQTIEYKDFVFANRNTTDDQHILIIQGQKDASSNVPALGLFIQDSTEITTKTYDEGDGGSGNAILYADTSSVNYSSLYMLSPSNLKIAITRIDSVYVSGTFSSKVADLNGNVKDISEGVFQARFQ